MTKICKTCGIEKSLSDFALNGKEISGKVKYKPACKKCLNAATKIQKIELINSILEELNWSFECALCGYSKNRAALCFHHLDDETKDFSIGGNGLKSRSKLKTEIEKCVILCHNCHMETHYPDLTLT